MQIIIDITGLTTTEQVLKKFGEVFEFGGPNGNRQTVSGESGIGWGVNWDALRDSLSCLDTGGIWGTSKKFEFPLDVQIIGCRDFKGSDLESFGIFVDIMENQVEEYARGEKKLTVVFS